MTTLVTLQGPNAGRSFSLDPRRSLIGRRPDSTVFLESLAVSREHAHIVCENGAYFLEDLGSSNGTFLNGKKIAGRTPFNERDTLQVGPYVFTLRPDSVPPMHEDELVIRSQIDASGTNLTLYAQNPTLKLQVVLEIAQHLGHTLDQDALLGKLLEHLLRLFPQADRGMALLAEGDRLVVKAQRARGAPADPVTPAPLPVPLPRVMGGAGSTDFPYSRTIVKKALEEGVGLLIEDLGSDNRFSGTATLMSLNLRSLLCVPLIGQNKRRLGVLQLDCSRSGMAFHSEDLELLTTVGLQVSVVLENAALHAERLREERFHQELALARRIQLSFLPSDFCPLGESNFELFASISPAREVSGDLYDFFALPDGRLAFLVGDVSGKGMPAAMFMVKVHTLCRYLASAGDRPSAMLRRLNSSLAAGNHSGLFVTVIHGIYTPSTGEVEIASCAHPLPLVRRSSGRVDEIPLETGLPLGMLDDDPGMKDARLTLAPGETLILYTDGFTEAFAPPGRKNQFGVERLEEALGGPRTQMSLAAAAESARQAVERFTASTEQQDDLTLLLLRRTA
jgi:serine phosphatase RsbU (regulator of sigma subunit)